jgi:uncharacterized heparinase superfamily protein
VISAAAVSGQAGLQHNDAARRAVAQRMLQWARGMAHPDGGVAFFNDSAFGIACTLAELEAFARTLGIAVADEDGSRAYPESGYVRLERGPAVALLDVAPVGPAYQPGHAHADTLSFELSLFGRRVLVNSGTSTYEEGRQRQWERGTAAHNTMVVDGQDSSEVWKSFRVARRALPFDRAIGAATGSSLTVACSHDGYRRLPGNVVHTRRWTMDASALEIVDTLSGRFERAQAALLFHPDVAVSAADAEQVRFKVAGRDVAMRVCGGKVRVEKGHWHPEFGCTLATNRVLINAEGCELRIRLVYA